MSLDYSLALRADGRAIEPAAVRALLVAAGLREAADPRVLIGDHLQASVLEPDPHASDPSALRVSFRLDKFALERAEDEMLDAVFRVVARLRARADLSFQGEDEILRFSPDDGRLELPDGDDFWTAARRARAHAVFPHAR